MATSIALDKYRDNSTTFIILFDLTIMVYKNLRRSKSLEYSLSFLLLGSAQADSGMRVRGLYQTLTNR